MPEVFDWQRVADPQAVLGRAVQALLAGRVVAFPTQTSYVLAAAVTAPEAVGHVAALRSPTRPAALAARGEPDALAWAPALGIAGRRLARRCWPGPVVLALAGVEPGLLDRLPEPVRELVCGAEGLRLWTPDHEAVLETLFHLSDSVVLAGVEGGPEEITAAAGDRLECIIADEIVPGQMLTVVRLGGDRWEVLRPGAVSAEELARLTNRVTVFVCTGNTCRSPLAEALCKKRLADRLGCAADELPARGFSVLSAGLAAMMGGEAAAEAVEVAHSYGADLARHRSRPLTVELAAQADDLIGMTRGHVTMMSEYYPRLGGEPRLLHPAGEDIADPVGCPRDVYEECARQIWQSLDSLVAEIVNEKTAPLTPTPLPTVGERGRGEGEPRPAD
jgi:protein-tyrosine phosphatase